MRDELKLKPCPACGADACNDGTFVACSDKMKCWVMGPYGDPAGAKWNALPRRTDAPSGMLDGELVARAILQVGIAMLAQRGTFRETAPGTLDAMNEELTNELNRRAAARKEATK